VLIRFQNADEITRLGLLLSLFLIVSGLVDLLKDVHQLFVAQIIGAVIALALLLTGEVPSASYFLQLVD
jgi:hypothetical protein